MLPYTLPPSPSSFVTTRDLAASNFPHSGVLNDDLWNIDADDSTKGGRAGVMGCTEHEKTCLRSYKPVTPKMNKIPYNITVITTLIITDSFFLCQHANRV